MQTMSNILSLAIWIPVAFGALLLANALAPHRQLQAQGASQRLAQVRDGRVRFTFALRPEVCGSGQNI